MDGEFTPPGVVKATGAGSNPKHNQTIEDTSRKDVRILGPRKGGQKGVYYVDEDPRDTRKGYDYPLQGRDSYDTGKGYDYSLQGRSWPNWGTTKNYEDWICPVCTYENYSRNSTCRNCTRKGAEKGEKAGKGKPGKGGKPKGKGKDTGKDPGKVGRDGCLVSPKHIIKVVEYNVEEKFRKSIEIGLPTRYIKARYTLAEMGGLAELLLVRQSHSPRVEITNLFEKVLNVTHPADTKLKFVGWRISPHDPPGGLGESGGLPTIQKIAEYTIRSEKGEIMEHTAHKRVGAVLLTATDTPVLEAKDVGKTVWGKKEDKGEWTRLGVVTKEVPNAVSTTLANPFLPVTSTTLVAQIEDSVMEKSDSKKRSRNESECEDIPTELTKLSDLILEEVNQYTEKDPIVAMERPYLCIRRLNSILTHARHCEQPNCKLAHIEITGRNYESIDFQEVRMKKRTEGGAYATDSEAESEAPGPKLQKQS
jgi:hypothetical protein